MDRHSGRSDRIGRQLLIGIAAFGMILSTTYAAGRMFMPTTAPLFPDIGGAIVRDSSVLDPAAQVAALPHPAAVVVASGAIEGRFLLDRVDEVSLMRGPGPDRSSNDIDIRYTESGSTLTLIARGITVDTPRTAQFTAVFSSGGQTFSSSAGDCTFAVSRFEYNSLPPQPPLNRSRLVASFTGELSCIDVAEIRSGAPASFFVAFDY